MALDDNATITVESLETAADILRKSKRPCGASCSHRAKVALDRIQIAEVLVRDIINCMMKGGDDSMLKDAEDSVFERAASVYEPPTPLKVTPRSAVESDLLAKVARAHEAFVLLDADQSGSLDVTELQVALRYMGIKEDRLDAVMEHVLRKVDPLGTNLVSLDQFISLFTDGTDDETINFLQSGFNNINEDLIEEFNKRTQGMVVGEDERILIDPRSRLSTSWDVFIAVLLIATIFTMPLTMAFLDVQAKLRPLDLLADVAFLLDIFKHFNTGYVDQFEFTVMDRRKVHWNYVSSWFGLDLISSVPIEIINLWLSASSSGGSDDGSVSDLRVTKIVKLLRLSRVAKVVRVFKLSQLAKLARKFQDRFEDYYQVKLDEASIAMMKLFLSLLILAHWIGCINFMICREFDFPSDSWVVNADLEHAPTSTQYMWCYFKALIAMIGLGFESPPLVNTVCTERTGWCTIEHWVSLVCLYIGSIFYAFLISSVSFVMANLDKGGSNLSETLWGISEYLRNKHIPVVLKDRVRTFFRVQYSEGKMYDREILSVLPRNLQRDIHAFNNRILFDKVPLLCDTPTTSRSMLTRLASVLSSDLVFSSETIIEEDAVGDEMFFISTGIVHIFSKFYEPPVKAIADGCYFGEVACLLECRRTATMRARTNVTLSVLQKKDLLSVVGDYPLVLKRMLRVAEKRRLRMSSLDSTNALPPLTEDQIVDEEDSETRYYQKVPGLARGQDTVFRAHQQQIGREGSSLELRPTPGNTPMGAAATGFKLDLASSLATAAAAQPSKKALNRFSFSSGPATSDREPHPAAPTQLPRHPSEAPAANSGQSRNPLRVSLSTLAPLGLGEEATSPKPPPATTPQVGRWSSASSSSSFWRPNKQAAASVAPLPPDYSSKEPRSADSVKKQGHVFASSMTATTGGGACQGGSLGSPGDHGETKGNDPPILGSFEV